MLCPSIDYMSSAYVRDKDFFARIYDTGEDGLIISAAGVAISLRSKEVLARLPKGASHLSMTPHPDDPWILAGTLRHYDPPGWNQAQRDSLVADAMVRVGDPYSWKGLAAQFLRDITGDESWPERLDEEADICSEAGCELYRRQDPTYGGPGPCSKKRPGELEKWMQEQGWKCVEVEVL